MDESILDDITKYDERPYFTLDEKPFELGPDQRYLCYTEPVLEAIRNSEYMVGSRTGPVYMYGTIGSGKTTILRRLTDTLSERENYDVRLILLPPIKTANALLREIMDAFDVKTEKNFSHALKNLEQFLIDAFKDGRMPILLVDEAQNMSRDMLKLIHYLLNFETAKVKLLQIVLSGQQELGVKILKYPELASRMFPIAMQPMTAAELQKMIDFRWNVAGGDTTKNPFTGDDLFDVLYACSKGVPRDAIRICKRTLISLMLRGQYRSSAEHIDEIASLINLSK